jgi:hypothetical protein
MGCIYSKATKFLAGIRNGSEERAGRTRSQKRRRRHARWSIRLERSKSSRPIRATAAIFTGLTWRVTNAPGRGLTLEQIRDELLNERDLSKKSSRKRQLECAERTVRKAIEQVPSD